MNAKIIPFPGCEDVLAKSKPKQKEVYYGNPRSRKYHAPGCRYFKNMKDAVIFKSKEEARAARFLPCGLCYPYRGQFKQEMEAFKKKLAERLRRQQGKVVTQKLIVRKESGFWRIRTDKGGFHHAGCKRRTHLDQWCRNSSIGESIERKRIIA